MSEMNTKILVVDDSSTMRRILRTTLMRIGFTDVSEAGDGAQALVKCSEEQYEIVLTDWNMPEVDGLELTIKLRQKDNYKKVPIMMVTTEGGKQDVVEAIMQGVSSYIVKPFTADILKEKMDDLLSLTE